MRSEAAEYAEALKKSAKELIDDLETETEEGQKIIRLIYEIIRSSFLEGRRSRVNNED